MTAAVVPELTEDDVVAVPGGWWVLRSEYEAWLGAPVNPYDQHVTAVKEFEALARAMAVWPPPCDGDTRFISDELDVETRAELAQRCETECQIRSQCDAYAKRVRPAGGIWAGMVYPSPGDALWAAEGAAAATSTVDQEWVTTAAAAAEIGKDQRTIRRWVASGDLLMRVGRVRRADVVRVEREKRDRMHAGRPRMPVDVTARIQGRIDRMTHETDDLRDANDSPNTKAGIPR